MATDPIEKAKSPRELLRPPVPGGTGHVQILGRWIDDLMGHSKIVRQAEQKMAEFLSEVNNSHDGSDEPAPEPLPDPPLIELPPPVPDGTGTEERGDKPRNRSRRRP